MVIVIASSIAAVVGFLYYKRQQEIKTYTHQLAENSSLGQLRNQYNQLFQSTAAQESPAFQEALATFIFLKNTNNNPSDTILTHTAESLNHYQALADTYRQLTPPSYLKSELYYPQQALQYTQDVQNQFDSLCLPDAVGAPDTPQKITNLQRLYLPKILSQSVQQQTQQPTAQLLNPNIVSTHLLPLLQELEASPNFQSKLNSLHYTQFWQLPEILQIQSYVSSLFQLTTSLQDALDAFPPSYKKSPDDKTYIDECEAKAKNILLSLLPQSPNDLSQKKLSPADIPSILAQFSRDNYPFPFQKMKTTLLDAATTSTLTLKYRPAYTLQSIQTLSLQIIEDCARLQDLFDSGAKYEAFSQISTLYRDFFERERYQERYLRFERRQQ